MKKIMISLFILSFILLPLCSCDKKEKNPAWDFIPDGTELELDVITVLSKEPHEKLYQICAQRGKLTLYGYADENKNIVIAPTLTKPLNFCDGYASTGRNYIDINGKYLLNRDSTYDCFDFSGGAAVIYDLLADAVSVINTKGKIIKTFDSKMKMNSGVLFSEGLLQLQEGGKTFFVDKNGETAFAFSVLSLYSVGNYSEDIAAVSPDGKKILYYNKKGERAFNPVYEFMPIKYADRDIVPYAFKGGFAAAYKIVDTEGKWGIIDKKGNAAVKFIYDTVPVIYNCGLYRLKEPGGEFTDLNFYDLTGKLKFDFEKLRNLKYVGDFSGGVAVCSNSQNKYGFIKADGTFLIPSEYTLCFKFQNEFGCVGEDGNILYYNEQGALTFAYDMTIANNMINLLELPENNIH